MTACYRCNGTNTAPRGAPNGRPRFFCDDCRRMFTPGGKYQRAANGGISDDYPCPFCGSLGTRSSGIRHGNRPYRDCRDCGRRFSTVKAREPGQKVGLPELTLPASIERQPPPLPPRPISAQKTFPGLDKPRIDGVELASRLREVISKIATLHAAEDWRGMQREARNWELAKNQAWIQTTWAERTNWFADGIDVEPERIQPRLVFVSEPWQRDLFQLARYTWSMPYSKGYGRRQQFLLIDEGHGKLMGLLGLCSPALNQGFRDADIRYPAGRKHEMVNQTMEAYTVGAIPPYGRLLAGKLAVYAAASAEVLDRYQTTYTGRRSKMRGIVHPGHLALITTTSAYGRSSMYNRVTYHGRRIAERAGYTKGWGDFPLKPLSPDILRYLNEMEVPVVAGYGPGPMSTRPNIVKACRLLGIKSALKHGIQREAWRIPLATNWREYLAGQAAEPSYIRTPFADFADWWRERWLLPRSVRIGDWREHRKETVILDLTLPSM